MGKGRFTECSGNADTCDATTCCKARATCDLITTPCGGSTPINEGSGMECSGNAATCDATTCCKACDETLSGEKDSGYRGCQDKTRSGEICAFWQDFGDKTRYESLYPNKGVGGNHNYCRNPNGGPTIWCFTENGFGQCGPKGFEKARATCDLITTPCGGSTPVNKGRGTECSGNAATCDATTCCKARATCDFITTPCGGSTPVNKGRFTECSGNADTCDATTCCKARATCDLITTPCGGSTPVNKGRFTECSGNADTCDATTCCKARATCDPM